MEILGTIIGLAVVAGYIYFIVRKRKAERAERDGYQDRNGQKYR